MLSWGRIVPAIGRCSTGWGSPTLTGSTASWETARQDSAHLSILSLSPLALALAHAPPIDTPSHALLALALYQVLQCYAQRMERVRQSKLKLAKAIGTAGYYHTTVIDMRGLSAAFLKHRAMIQ